MLVTIYYLVGILVFLSVLSNTLRFRKIYSVKEWREKYEKIIGKKPERKNYRTKKEYSLLESYNILSLFEFLWIFMGLFTGSWYVFVALLLMSYIFNLILNPIKWSIFYKISTFTFIIIKISLYLYLIVNHFYLHIDTYKLIVNTISKW